VPTLNGGQRFRDCLKALKAQKPEADEIIVIDSGSQDGTAEAAGQEGCRVVSISQRDFRHGGTRQLGASLAKDKEILIYLTQDAVLANTSAVGILIAALQQPEVAAAYGRQLPRQDADPIEAHGRLFNYSQKSQIRSFTDALQLGIKTAFISNAFAAYRREALFDIGGFPLQLNFGEDMYVGGKLLQRGWKIAYCADAEVCHSHRYDILDEFKRNYDIGIFHSREYWLLETFGTAFGEGLKFVTSEMRYMWKNAPGFMPLVLLRSSARWLGYALGRRHLKTPAILRKHMSMYGISE
jgi:rhamnosyltransferase